ncbi:hypothetical protein TNIN_213361 [Trichonephila inaurata madagascariensis]|uniref:Uncharacterized protein n=1 Tax=Trichonephila inaurata madagascariensis TaxID=2747483 RepID=A0A8X6YQN1_9ARAC|nr:hypothetical protein TNIN_213361 [Trichonephila inaurata madagascariensis]
MKTNSTTQTTNNKINTFTQTISIQHDKKLKPLSCSKTIVHKQEYKIETLAHKPKMKRTSRRQLKTKIRKKTITATTNITRSTNLDDFNRYFDLEQLSVQSSSQSSDTQKPKKKKSGWRKLKKTVSKFTKSVK